MTFSLRIPAPVDSSSEADHSESHFQVAIITKAAWLRLAATTHAGIGILPSRTESNRFKAPSPSLFALLPVTAAPHAGDAFLPVS